MLFRSINHFTYGSFCSFSTETLRLEWCVRASTERSGHPHTRIQCDERRQVGPSECDPTCRRAERPRTCRRVGERDVTGLGTRGRWRRTGGSHIQSGPETGVAKLPNRTHARFEPLVWTFGLARTRPWRERVWNLIQSSSLKQNKEHVWELGGMLMRQQMQY